jgi:hypothetical protein
MPRPVPGRGHFGPDGQIPPDSVPSPVPSPDNPSDLATRLNALAGGSLADLAPTDDLLLEFNEVFTTATYQRFEHRALLGIAINAMRPAHGKVTEYTERVAKRLERGTRWVQDTVSVAECIELAIDQGVHLPLEIREIHWRKVPIAVDNIRNGRPLDFTPRKSKAPTTPEERAQAVAKALEALTRALDDIESSIQRTDLAAEAIETLRPYADDDHADPEPQPEPERTAPAEPEREPEPTPQPPSPGRLEPRTPQAHDPDTSPEPSHSDSEPRPSRPGRARPDGRPRRPRRRR